ncbi:MAG: DNA translocase FtsK 4TM domain-containing protein [Bacteroidales bacterium]|nr:DNA translocase FtsK 4TM domain-containing protein [Bacteroidales bacterium]
MTTKNKIKSKPAKPKSEVNSKKKTGFGKGLWQFLTNSKFHRILGLFLTLFSIYLFAAFISYFFSWRDDDGFLKNNTIFNILFGEDVYAQNVLGRLGALLAYAFIKKGFGFASFAFVFIFFLSGVRVFLSIRLLPLRKSLKHVLFWLLWLSLTMGFFFKKEPFDILGGAFGIENSDWLKAFMGNFGLAMFLFFALIVYIIIIFNVSFTNLFKSRSKEETEEDPSNINKKEENENDVIPEKETPNTVELSLDTNDILLQTDDVEEDIEEENETTSDYDKSDIELEIEEVKQNDKLHQTNHTEEVSDTDEMLHIPISEPYDPRLELPAFQFPPFDLLDDYDNTSASVKNDELQANKKRILDTLENYSIKIEKIKATIGPTVTLYEIVPAPGIRISKIKNLEDDIALSLSALGIRIIAPMPGKGTIGIEVPNQNPEIVSMKSILISERFQNNKFDLPIGLGKTISNESFVADLTKMPHLLMAGATGQGKSVGINAVLASLLYKKHPSELKFVLVDPKKVELSLFSKIERHYLAKLPDSDEAIITDTRKVVRTLNSLCIEMDNRYDLLKDAQVRNIKEYNSKFIARRLNPESGHKFLPYIVLIVDEFADLIMTAGKEVEGPIARLAQLARAVGIHLIIATQRPSVNIITGTIKANFPARLAFRVTSKIDSRTILDTGGADQLIGRGDMLLSTGSDLMRLQCAFIDIHEVEKVTDFIGSQRAFPDAHLLPEYVDEQADNDISMDSSDRDSMFEEAAKIIVIHQQGSTSLIQRKLKLGYNRAGRIIDQLEAAGIVGSFEGSKAREVKYKDLFALEQYLNSLKNN